MHIQNIRFCLTDINKIRITNGCIPIIISSGDHYPLDGSISFSVRKKKTFRWPKAAHDSWGGLWPPKSSFLLTEKEIETAKESRSVTYAAERLNIYISRYICCTECVHT